ncbi:MAG: hypothetical protein K0U78_14675 [Actinomycetia bacterium]|nr:hypothetical protein [Actinomycetes bacterium]
METVVSTESGTGNGVRPESSLPFKLNDIAHDCARIEMGIDYKDKQSIHHYEVMKSHPRIILRRSKDKSNYKAVKCTREDYIELLGCLKDDLRAMLDDDNDIQSDNYYFIVNSINEPIAGFTTNGNGYLGGFFSLLKGKGEEFYKIRLDQALMDANINVEEFKLFCTGDFLREFYERHGFEVSSIVIWDDNHAPDKWDYDKHGRPNLYMMRASVSALAEVSNMKTSDMLAMIEAYSIEPKWETFTNKEGSKIEYLSYDTIEVIKTVLVDIERKRKVEKPITQEELDEIPF